MPEADLIALDFKKHGMQCPHCQAQTVHHSPAKMILFATVKCEHCLRNFSVAMGKPHRPEFQQWSARGARPAGTPAGNEIESAIRVPR